MTSNIWMRAAEQIRSVMSAGDPSPELVAGLARLSQCIGCGLNDENEFREAILFAFPVYGVEHAETCVAAVRERIAVLQSGRPRRHHRHGVRRLATYRRRPADP